MLDRIAHAVSMSAMWRWCNAGNRASVLMIVADDLPVKDSDGCVMVASAIARDVTVKKRIEAALRESEARFR